ncbi:signal peptide peptidase SppA [Roseburia hominis]
MKNKQIIGLVVAAVLFVVVGFSSVLSHALSERIFSKNTALLEELADETSFTPPDGKYIGIVQVTGTIQEQTQESLFEAPAGYQHLSTMEYIDNLAWDDNNTGILLYIDSPGGTVYESEELYDKLKEYSESTGRPIWAYMAHYAASGGYMASVAADKIYANKNTVTGSIGVIMSGYDLSGLYEKLGIRYISITSGANKDSSKMTEEQIAIYQSQVDECYDAFVTKVAEGRNMSTDAVRTLADGRTYTALQAVNNGLVDEISSYEEMRAAFEEELDTYMYYDMPAKTNFFSSLFSELKEIVPKSEAQILTETADKMESGVLMYYAEQLR